MDPVSEALQFAGLLRSADIDPAAVVMLRHQPVESRLRRILPWLVGERPDLFLAYQSTQWASAERLMVRATVVAAFVGQAPAKATFAGLFRLKGHTQLDYAGYHALPGNPELIELGMTGIGSEDRAPLAFDMEAMSQLATFVGRLVIDWPKPERVWARWADRGLFPICSLCEESRFDRGMPDWSQLVLSWPELSTLPPSWRSSLAEWRGVYFIYDQNRCKGYVGSASGADNLLGRWREYAQTGHGGNKRLRQSHPQDLVFSILQRVSPDLAPAEVVAIENSWKERLHTRAFGLNEN